MAGCHGVPQHRNVVLTNIEDIIRFSFIARNSISYLNLQLLEYSNLNDCYRTISEVANDFVCTEEKCRKIFTPNRSLLHKLNLDIPVSREYKLKNDIPADNFSTDYSIPHDIPEDYFYTDYSIPHIGKITQQFDFDFRNTHRFIKEALEFSDQNKKLKILGLLLKSAVLKMEIFNFLSLSVINKFIPCFYPEITDSVLFKEFISTSHFRSWMLIYEEPKILEYLLYHARRHGIILEKDGYTTSQRIEYYIFSPLYSNIEPFLKYTDTAEFSSKTYRNCKSSVLFLRPNVIEQINTKIYGSPQVLYLMLQVFHMYVVSNRIGRTESASEALRLLWSSSPVPFITYEEIQKTFKGIIDDEEIEGMYEFYSNSINEDHSVVRPRSLKHLCRVTIRRILTNNFWIPEGVKLTGLPKSLQSYLNLDKYCYSYL